MLLLPSLPLCVVSVILVAVFAWTILLVLRAHLLIFHCTASDAAVNQGPDMCNTPD